MTKKESSECLTTTNNDCNADLTMADLTKAKEESSEGLAQLESIAQDSTEFLMDVVQESSSFARLSRSCQMRTSLRDSFIERVFSSVPPLPVVGEPVRQQETEPRQQETTEFVGAYARSPFGSDVRRSREAHVHDQALEDVSNVSGRIRGPNPLASEEALAVAAEIAPEDDAVKAEELKRQITEQIKDNAPLAVVVPHPSEELSSPPEDKKAPTRRSWIIPVVIIFLLVAAAVAGAVVAQKDKGGQKETTSSGSPTQDESVTEQDEDSDSSSRFALLDEIKQRNSLRCGVSIFNLTAGQHQGVEYDLCRAVAASIFDDSEDSDNKIEPILVKPSTRFDFLHNGLVDMLAEPTTHTMERDLNEKMTQGAFTFSVPYLYTGLGFAGYPEFVDCAQSLDSTTGLCANLTICVTAYTTTADKLLELFPNPVQIIQANNSATYKYSFLDLGACNVVAADSSNLLEDVYRDSGYVGPWKKGDKLFSKDPLTLVTRATDAQFAAHVNTVVNILYSAEAQGWTLGDNKDTILPTVDGNFRSMVIRIISKVGNMGELYDRDSTADRQGLNRLHTADSTGSTTGLIYSHPFGKLDVEGNILLGGTIDSILQRGYLRCGVSSNELENNISNFVLAELMEDGTWQGLGAEYCRALSAALFGFSSTGADEYIQWEQVQLPYNALAKGNVDVLVGERVDLQTSWKMDQTTKEGFVFSPPFFYDQDGDAFALATRQSDPQWSKLTYWIVMATFYAEEQEINQVSHLDMPQVFLFGEAFQEMFQSCIQEVGNYGEMYRRTMGSSPSQHLNGQNQLNLNGDPQQFGFPFV